MSANSLETALVIQMSTRSHHVDGLWGVSLRNIFGILRSIAHAGLKISTIHLVTSSIYWMPGGIHRVVVGRVAYSWSRRQQVVRIICLIVKLGYDAICPGWVSQTAPAFCGGRARAKASCFGSRLASIS